MTLHTSIANRRHVLGLLAGAATSALLVGCSGGSTASNAVAQAPPPTPAPAPTPTPTPTATPTPTIAGTYVDHVAGDDTRTSGTYDAPVRTTARAKDLVTTAAPVAVLARGERHPTRLADYVAIAPNIVDYGPSALAPLLDFRQDLSGLTWTLLAGSTTTWETMATLAVPLLANGINTANGSKFVFYRDHNADDSDPTGASLAWITNHASVAANDATIKTTPGSWGINVTGSAMGDIRNDASGATAVRLVVHPANGEDPNGKPYRLMDGKGYQFAGGAHGQLRFIGGGSKDNISFALDASGVVPTFQSFEGIDLPCHGGVGPRNHVGLCKLIGRPIEGEEPGTRGRTAGGGLHLFTDRARPGVSISTGSVQIENFDAGAIYGHGAGTRGYGGRFDLHQGGRINNCGWIYSAADTSNPGFGFFETAVELDGYILAQNMTNGFSVDDVPTFTVTGVGGNRSLWKTGMVDNAAFVSIIGAHPSILIAHQDVDFSGAGTRTLIGAGSYIDPANPDLRPTVELRDFHDVTPVDGRGGKAGVFGAERDTPRNFDINLVLTENTELGAIWAYPGYATYPRSFRADGSKIRFGTFNQTRQQFRDAMAALGRTCVMPDSVTMVDRSGAVVDAGL